MVNRVAILISGSGTNMVNLVESMTGDHPARPTLVLSNRPEAVGIDRARALGVSTAVVDHRDFRSDREAFDSALSDIIAAHDAEIICLAGFMRVLTAKFVEAHAGRIMNIHPSLLPKYKGLDTHARALAAGDAEAGCTVHEVTAGLDSGKILGQARVPVHPGDTPAALAARVLEVEHRLYPITLRRFASGDRTRSDMLPHPNVPV